MDTLIICLTMIYWASLNTAFGVYLIYKLQGIVDSVLEKVKNVKVDKHVHVDVSSIPE